MSTMNPTTEFTAYRCSHASDATMCGVALSDSGFHPVFKREAECKRNPQAKRAWLVNLPSVERGAFRVWKSANPA
jgi:hypothetical protein